MNSDDNVTKASILSYNKIIQHSKFPKKDLVTTKTEINYDANGVLLEVKYYDGQEVKTVQTFSYIYW